MTAQSTMTNTFPQFSRRPPELRLKIWEETWPGTRIMEITYADCPQQTDLSDAEGYPESVILRPMCSISRWKQYAKSGAYRNFEAEEPLEACPNPTALYVCHESRIHTLRQYIEIQHGGIITDVFYMNPKLDILWLSEDTSDDMEKLNSLKYCYGNQIELVSQVLVGEAEWDTREYLLDFFGMLKGLHRVYVAIDKSLLYGTGDGQRKITTAMRNATSAYIRRRDSHRSADKRWKIVYKQLD